MKLTIGVDRFIDIAKKHLQYIKRSKKGPLYIDINEFHACDHALIVSIFSAAAVEAAINNFILLRLAFYTDKKYRALLINLILKKPKTIEERLKIIENMEPNLKLKNDKELKELFKYRNDVLHYKGKYEEYKKSVTFKGPSIKEIELASKHFETAQRVVKLLDSHLENKDWSHKKNSF